MTRHSTPNLGRVVASRAVVALLSIMAFSLVAACDSQPNQTRNTEIAVFIDFTEIEELDGNEGVTADLPEILDLINSATPQQQAGIANGGSISFHPLDDQSVHGSSSIVEIALKPGVEGENPLVRLSATRGFREKATDELKEFLNQATNFQQVDSFSRTEIIRPFCSYLKTRVDLSNRTVTYSLRQQSRARNPRASDLVSDADEIWRDMFRELKIEDLEVWQGKQASLVVPTGRAGNPLHLIFFSDLVEHSEVHSFIAAARQSNSDVVDLFLNQCR